MISTPARGAQEWQLGAHFLALCEESLKWFELLRDEEGRSG